MAKNLEEQSLIIVKPDAIQRSLLGAIISRLEQKGLKIIALKMARLGDVTLDDHYAHHKDKAFFGSLKRFMQSAPVALIVVSGIKAVQAVRLIVGPTKGYEADAGSIRGDFSLSGQTNIVHASDSVETAVVEIRRFFTADEIHGYSKPDFLYLGSEDERGVD
ncbi:MAG: nucleoside-diphosphate kinase [Patescibacteria group bacterium]